MEALEFRWLLNAAGADTARLTAAYGQVPLNFEANEGQTDSRVQFLARGEGYALFLTPTAAVFRLARPAAGAATVPQAVEGTVLDMQLVGANPTPRAHGQDPQAATVNYFIGNDPSQWRRNVPTFGAVGYDGVYPGIDLVYYGNQRQLEYDFRVAPGADPNAITLAFPGADGFDLDSQGNLVLHTAGGDVVHHAPVVYQERPAGHETVAGRYVVEGNGRVGFAVGPYDHARPLVIDPTLAYSTYLGGTAADQATGIAVDDAGNAYVTGFTQSRDFPITPGAYRTTFQGTAVAFVTKLNAAGTGLVYSTYLGGGNDGGADIVVDGAGNAYVVGATGSANFPTTAGAYQRTLRGAKNLFVTKLNAAGNSLVYSTYLGGSGSDTGNGIAVDGAGNAYVGGFTSSGNFPTTPGAPQRNLQGATDGFVAKLNASGMTLAYGTYLGGISSDSVLGIAVDAAGNAYATGYTYSSNFPTTPGAYQTYNWGPPAAFVTKINAAGTGFVYSTFLGGGADEIPDDMPAGAIAVDAAGHAYVTGYTFSNVFPTTPGAYQTGNHGASDAYVTKLNPTGTGLVYSTYLGGASFDAATSIALDSTGAAYVTGYTISGNFPTTSGAFQTGDHGLYDAFLTKLNPQGTGLAYSTYIGGGNNDYGSGVDVDAAGDAYLTGFTLSSDFPTSATGYQRTNRGLGDGFVTKLALSDPATHFRVTATAVATAGTAFNVSVTALDAQNRTATDYRGTAHFTSTDPAAELPADYAFTLTDAGVHTFTVTLLTAGGRSVTAADRANPSLNGTAPVTVVPAATARLSVTGFPSPATAGSSSMFHVTAQDAYGNTTPGYAGTVQFGSSDPQAVLPAAYTFTFADQGSHVFSATLKTAASQSLTATDSHSGSITGTQAPIMVVPAAANHLMLTAPASVPTRTPFSLTVTARDPFNNVVTTFGDTVSFTSSDPQAGLPPNYTFRPADAGQHTFTVALATPGRQTVTATDVANRGVTGSAAVTVTRQFFLPPVDYAVDAGPQALAVGDVNGDGIPDLAVANRAGNDVTILLGQGDGTFVSAGNLATDPDALAVALADVNGDGLLDLVVANGTSGTVTVFLGQGDGTFVPTPSIPLGFSPAALAVGDVNGDGIPDLVLADPADGAVVTLLGNGDGSFQPPVSSPAGGAPVSVALGDVNGDGIPDVITANPADNTVSVLLGQGDGTFAFNTGLVYPVGTAPVAVVAADLNGDGILDLVVANSGSGDVSVLLGNGDGSFQAAVANPVGTNPLGVAVGDFNSDGVPDVAVANQADNTAAVLVGNGDGSFQAALSFAVGSGPAAVVAADFNGDQAADLVTADAGAGTVSVLLNADDWPPVPGASVPGGASRPIALSSGVLPDMVGPGAGSPWLRPSDPVASVANPEDSHREPWNHLFADAEIASGSGTQIGSAPPARQTLADSPPGDSAAPDALPEWAFLGPWRRWDQGIPPVTRRQGWFTRG